MVAPSEESERAEQATASAPPGEQAEAQPGPSFARVAEDVRVAAAEFGEYARYLLALKIDQTKLLAKRAVFLAVVGVLAAVAIVGLVAAGMTLLMLGVAGLIGSAFGNFWLGATIVGVAMLVVMAAGAYIGWILLHRMTFRSLREKYAQRRESHKQAFGRDIQEVSRG